MLVDFLSMYFNFLISMYILNVILVENAMVDELFNSQECEKAICDPDEDLLLFLDTLKTEEFDDIMTMKYLILSTK